jgi:hypothetical protein
MGFPGYGRSIRASLAYVGMAAATASALVVLQSGAAFAVGTVVPDAITVAPDSGNAATAQEGDSTGNFLVATFTDTGNSIDVNCEEQYVATINWGDGSTSTGTVTCERVILLAAEGGPPNGIFDVTGSHTYADSASAAISVSVVDNSESAESSGAAVNTDTATVTDADLGFDGDNSTRGSYAGVEGKSVKVAVDFFDDRNSEGRDASIAGTINWGDGSATQTVAATDATGICDCGSNDAEISASHVYADAGAYKITVTAKDDGGSMATASYSANVSDGKLTADANKSLTATAGASLSGVLGSFTDEAGAQAAAGDFAAMISWGDGSLYSGTVAKTGSGAFSVSGTHTYASAGSKSITATVTDEEGNTVTLHATATVGAAPVVLPATGQPHPTLPAVPVIPLALLILCLGSLAVGGRILVKMPR